ncbi:vacuolar-processing enzyme-like isoform X1 [Papaver somniferum]|uniref:vacuolar-processing enzyme-like isoform X1 n=2 Tax=Papaver somniferum TaxID=3469 RepID=UPI000E6FDC73|nr:vacuolar-processing enzyme-like isoform X1 [Papaver somniferum]
MMASTSMNRCFLPHADNKAMNQALRIGQSNRLMVSRLVVNASFEEAILKSGEKKPMLVQQSIVNKFGSYKKVENIRRWGTEGVFTESFGGIRKDSTDNSSGEVEVIEHERKIGGVLVNVYEEQGGIEAVPAVSGDVCESNPEKKQDAVVGATEGTRWAILIAGSKGYGNYRHQAAVCHAYQILKDGGLNDENIVVMMYGDIVYDENNPTPGILINEPNGPDVYQGVPKDYVGEDVNSSNFWDVLLGNKNALAGTGSGKVVASGPNDTIFIYYADHGAPSRLSMPSPDDGLDAEAFNLALQIKHYSKGYKSMLIYIEACYAGAMFQTHLKPGLNVYATTASDPTGKSFGCFSLPEYGICVADFYSAIWMRHCHISDMTTVTLNNHYEFDREETSRYQEVSVTRYGDIEKLGDQSMSTYIGGKSTRSGVHYSSKTGHEADSHNYINRIDIGLAYFQQQYQNDSLGTKLRAEAWRTYQNGLLQRIYIEASMDLIGEFLFGTTEKATTAVEAVRPAGQPIVDDWNCYQTMVETYEKICGPFSPYGLEDLRALATICNAGVKPEDLAKAAEYACSILGKRPLQLEI